MSEPNVGAPVAQADPVAAGVNNAPDDNAAAVKTDAAGDAAKAGDAEKGAEGADASGKAADADAGDTVPESYDLQVPKDSLLKPTDVDRLKAEAKDMGLTNEEAQDYLDANDKAVASFHAAQMAEVKEIRDGWVKTAQSDKEIGGDNLKPSAELGRRAIEKYDPSGTFKELLNVSGYGDHPEVIRFFARIGKAMANDVLVHPKASSPEAQKD